MNETQRQAIKKVIERHTQVNTVSRTAARAALVREGIHSLSGRLTPEYGGQPKKKAAAARS